MSSSNTSGASPDELADATVDVMTSSNSFAFDASGSRAMRTICLCSP
ncbi:MAG: hypothetical protein NT013_10295 [Planctomycetia bacterium]|nr:hypothetical protein [Planctomycetia bacterium]